MEAGKMTKPEFHDMVAEATMPLTVFVKMSA
jgi:hypothetical protein